jgi:hypothetical protein
MEPRREAGMLVHIVADYGHGDLAFAEVVQRIRLHLPDAEIVPVPVPPFATLAAGFCVAQLGLNPAPPGTVVYHNVAPREDEEEAREGNEGERLAYALLPNGVRVVGVNAGHAFSFVRDAAEELRWAPSRPRAPSSAPATSSPGRPPTSPSAARAPWAMRWNPPRSRASPRIASPTSTATAT